MQKRTIFRGPVGFTPAESKIAAGLAVLVFVSTGVVLYRRLVRPAPQVFYEIHTVPSAQSSTAGSSTSEEPATAGSVITPVASWVGGQLDINSADYADLVKLPGIGPVLATRIMEYRDRHGLFPAVDSLLCVSGIGLKKLEKIRPLVHIR